MDRSIQFPAKEPKLFQTSATEWERDLEKSHDALIIQEEPKRCFTLRS